MSRHYDDENLERIEAKDDHLASQAAMNDSERIQPWFFTFGYGQVHQNQYVCIRGTFASAREEMFRRYGDKWAFQYDLDTFRMQPSMYGIRPVTPADDVKLHDHTDRAGES